MGGPTDEERGIGVNRLWKRKGKQVTAQELVQRHSNRIARRVGTKLNDKWARQFVDAGYKYVFTEIPIQPWELVRPSGFPGDKPKPEVWRLGKAPEGDVVFGNSLDDLSWFDSKKEPTSSLTPRQRLAYPPLNDNGGQILWKETELPRNWVDGSRVDLHGRQIGPGRGYIAHDVDLAAVASGQRDLAEMLAERRGQIIPGPKPTPHLALEDSRMLTDRGGVRRPTKSGTPASGAGPVTEARGASEITDVERGLETAARPMAHAPSAVSAIRDVSKAAKRAGRVRSVARAALAIGTKAWRATRTIGKVVIHFLVPLTPLDLAIDLALLAWDLWNLADDVNESLKKEAFEAVAKQRKADIESELQYKILDNQNTLQGYMRRWDEDPSFSGFLYARVVADMISDDRQRNFVQRVAVSATYVEHATEYTHGDSQLGIDTSVLKYTMYPPYLTPFDILLTKVTNLFVDTLYFAGSFSNDAEGFVQRFSDLGGIHYNESYASQYEGVFQFSSPLVAARCEYCLKYLHWAAGRLSQHALVPGDLEGNLENPMKGLRRRHAILVKLLEGKGSGQGYSGNFSRLAEYLNRLVKDGSETPETRKAMTELYLGATVIWADLLRIERNLPKPEYFYYGPNFRPGK